MKLVLHDYEYIKNIDLLKWEADIYFSFEWLSYLKKALNVKPFILEIIDQNNTIGYFVGATFVKFGIKIVASPFRGWDTPYMGLLLKKEYSRLDVLNIIWEYCHDQMKCMYMEVCDRKVNKEEIKTKDIPYIIEKTYYMDISKDNETLLKGFTKHCRKNIRLFVNRGATISRVDYSSNFLDSFYDMLVEVFKVQNLEPPYSKEKLNILFTSMKPENMLCLETYNPTGKCIGRSVSFGFSNYCYAFASATDRSENYNQKNYLRWEAIKYWRDKGKKYYDLMGVRDYKLEFNPQEVEFVRIVFTRWRLLLTLRNMAKVIYWKINKFKHYLKNNTK